MPYVIVFLLFVSGLVVIKPGDHEPNVMFGFMADGQAINMERGAPIDLAVLEARFKLTPESEAKFPALKGQPIRGTGEVTLARASRRVGMLEWNWNDPLPVDFSSAQFGNRVIITIKLIEIRQKDGNWLKLSEKALPMYQFGLY